MRLNNYSCNYRFPKLTLKILLTTVESALLGRRLSGSAVLLDHFIWNGTRQYVRVQNYTGSFGQKFGLLGQ